MIEVSANYENNFINGDKELKFISGLLSKYSSYKSYTSGGSEVGIKYVNNSTQTLHLTEFRVRILDPNTEQVAENIGSDNTIVMQLN